MGFQLVYVAGVVCDHDESQFPMAGLGVYYGLHDERNKYAPLTYVDNIFENRPSTERAELSAFRQALADIVEAIEAGECVKATDVFIESPYCIKVLSQLQDLEEKGYKRSNGGFVRNCDILSEISDLLEEIGKYYRLQNWRLLRVSSAGPFNFEKHRARTLARLGADAMEAYEKGLGKNEITLYVFKRTHLDVCAVFLAASSVVSFLRYYILQYLAWGLLEVIYNELVVWGSFRKVLGVCKGTCYIQLTNGTHTFSSTYVHS